MGVLLLAYSGFVLLSRVRTRVAWGGRVADSVVGFAGGVLGGLAGLSGPLPTVWATLRGWGKDKRRGVIQAFNLSILTAVAVAYAASGLFTVELDGWPFLPCPARLPELGLDLTPTTG